jgi:hypothetical protein
MWDWFKTRAENAALRAEVSLLRSQSDKLEWKVAELEKEVRSERNKKDRFVTQYCNQISQKNGLYGVFEDKKPREVEKTERNLSQAEEDKLYWLATQMREDDLQNDLDKPIDTYLNQMKQPDKVEYYLSLA